MTDKRDALRFYARLEMHPSFCTASTLTARAHAHVQIVGAVAVSTPLRAAGKRQLSISTRPIVALRNWRYNIGLRMGRQPGGFRLLAIDVDGPRELLAPLEAQLGHLPPTLTARTGSGGTHLIFRVDPRNEFNNKVRVDGREFDVRCDGGQIVAAPSLHLSGIATCGRNRRRPGAP